MLGLVLVLALVIWVHPNEALGQLNSRLEGRDVVTDEPGDERGDEREGETSSGLADEAPPAPSAVDATNFVVIYCDNLGYGDTEPFGSHVHRTPHLKRMAAEGRKFTHFYSTSGVCTPSRASLMTGCYAQRIGMHTNPRDGLVLRPVSPYGLNPAEETVAEVLKHVGYATAIIGKWHLGDQPAFLPTQQGFDWFYGLPYSDDMTERTWTDGSQWPPLPLMENEQVIEAPVDRNGLTRRYTELALQWIEEQRDTPFFLYLPHAMPGSTRQPFASSEFRGKSANGPWGDSIEELDWSIGQILDKLIDLGLAENTLVIWTSDNGAPVQKDPKDLSRGSNLPLAGRGYSTGEGGFRIPMIAWQPGKIPGGTECQELAVTFDLLPTFAGLADAKLPERFIDGKDIGRLFFEPSPPPTPHEAFYFYHQDQLQAVRSGPWKLFLPTFAPRHPHFRKPQDARVLLFNLLDDVGCQQDVSAQHPQTVAQLLELAALAREQLGDRDMVGSAVRPRGQLPAGALPTPRVAHPEPRS